MVQKLTQLLIFGGKLKRRPLLIETPCANSKSKVLWMYYRQHDTNCYNDWAELIVC